MKKYILPILLMSILPGIAFASSARFTQLVREKQQKMEQLEKCMGSTKGLKIAGISTLGLTAVGVAGNIAEAKMIKDNDSKIAKNEQKIKDATTDRDKAIKDKEERDKKTRFSLFEIELKDGVDVSYPDIMLTKDMINKKKNKD